MGRSAVFGLALLLAGCAGPQAPVGNLAALKAVAPVYRLAAGDQLRITVYNEDRLTGTYPVEGDGAIAFPLGGRIAADGLTTAEFSEQLAARLAAGLVKNPNVTTQVIAYRPYFILGEVERPGRYPTSEGMTVLRAVATAGGYTYRAGKADVFLKRGAAPEVRVPVEWDVPIQPGDVIRVGERYF